jgi:hypothetical protein
MNLRRAVGIQIRSFNRTANYYARWLIKHCGMLIDVIHKYDDDLIDGHAIPPVADYYFFVCVVRPYKLSIHFVDNGAGIGVTRPPRQRLGLIDIYRAMIALPAGRFRRSNRIAIDGIEGCSRQHNYEKQSSDFSHDFLRARHFTRGVADGQAAPLCYAAVA